MSVNATVSAAVDDRMAAGINTSNYQNILRNPKFQALVSSRGKFGWTLSMLMLVIYLGFILLVAYDKPFLAQKISSGSTISLGIVLGLCVIVSAFVLTGIYVARANGRFDDLTEQLKQEMGR